MSSKNTTESFSSRWGFIAATIGMAIGTGNIWRFPRVAATNGGGSFIIAWTIATLVWSVPLLMAEMVIGKKAKKGLLSAFKSFMGKKYTWMGGFIAMVCFFIMSYYSVVMGWCMKYFTMAVSGTFKAGMSIEDTTSIWERFTQTPMQTIFFHIVAICIATFIIHKGVTNGIEKTCKFLIPCLFLIMVIITIRTAFLPNAVEGYKYLFTPNLADLKNPRIWLEAFTQSAWSTGAGWGFIITYSAYTKEDTDIGLNCLLTGFGNNSASLIAAMAVVPTVFALTGGADGANVALTAGNEGLTFVYLAKLFPTMAGGRILSSLFFFAMILSALSSILAMLEVCVKILMDFGIQRHKGSMISGLLALVVGIPSAYNIHFLNNQDMVWGVGLLISGLFCACAMFKFGLEKARKEVINGPWSDIEINKTWSYMIKIFPILFTILFGWWIYQSITWYPNTWYSPFEKYSAGTIISQLGLLILILILSNNKINKLIDKREEKDNVA